MGGNVNTPSYYPQSAWGNNEADKEDHQPFMGSEHQPQPMQDYQPVKSEPNNQWVTN